MPELPDVEGFRRYLAHHAEGQRIVEIVAPAVSCFETAPPRRSAVR